MAKFCPKCGNQMSDNSKFCMECGTKLGDYTSGGAEIKDNLIQRSQVGAASVGKVEISPTINATATGGYVCRVCGSSASGKCDRCNMHICGKCFKEFYHVADLETSLCLLCNKCIEKISAYETEKIYNSNLSKISISGYFSIDEIDDKYCEICREYLADYRCNHCSAKFCDLCFNPTSDIKCPKCNQDLG
jgi:hypothetical protein